MRAILKVIKPGFSMINGNKKPLAVFKCEYEEGGKTISVWGAYSESYARDYFKYCGVLTKDLVGKEVEIILGSYKDKEGKEKPKIKFLNVLDKNDKPIVMPKELDF